ncbi:Hypothetical protein NTJ_09005 [Nesidiocoris tenuis]|uniref:FHA domain-containing protein n=1 Tax=Nesidiocoris tenuis TaxID=355587 RepID=A0ABN7AZ77_9HEMI|nr:Hypothetical protein NTJ_09005 [Nesidiocoris tenuis]
MVYGSLCLQGSEKAASRKFPITQQFTYVGKDKDCDIRFETAKFDGKQFLLTALQVGRVKIQNLSKRFPTLVNEKEIGFQVDRDIKENDVITAGCRKIKWSYHNSPGKNAAKAETIKRRASEPALRRVAVVNPCRREPVQEVEEPPPKRRRTAHLHAGPPTPHHCRSETFIPTPSALARRVQYDKTLRASRVSPMPKNQALRTSTQGATPKKVSFFHPPGTPNYRFNPPDIHNRSITPRTFYSRGLKSSTPYAFQGFNNISQDTPPSLLRDFSSHMTPPREKSVRVVKPYPDRKRSSSIRKSRNSTNRQLVAYFETIEENDDGVGPHGQNRSFLPDLNEFSRDQTPASYFSPPPNGSPRMMRAESPQLSQKLPFTDRQSLLSNNSQYESPSNSMGRSSQYGSMYVNPSSSQLGASFSGDGYSHNFTWNSDTPRSGWNTFSTTPPQLRTPRRSIIDETQGSASFSPMSCASLGPRSLSVGRGFRPGQPMMNTSRASFSFNTPPRRQLYDRALNKSLSVQVLSRAVRNKLSRGGTLPSPLTPASRRQNLTNIAKTTRSQPTPSTKKEEVSILQTDAVVKTPPKRKSSVKTQSDSEERKSSARRSQTSIVSSASKSSEQEKLPAGKKSVGSSSDDQAVPQIQTRTSLKNSQVQTRSSGGKAHTPFKAVAKTSLKRKLSGTVPPVKKLSVSTGSSPKTELPVALAISQDTEPVLPDSKDISGTSSSVKARRSVSIGGRSAKATTPGAHQTAESVAVASGRKTTTPRSRHNDISVSSPLNLSTLFDSSEPIRPDQTSNSQPRRTRSSQNDVSVVAVKTGIRKSKSASTSKRSSLLSLSAQLEDSTAVLQPSRKTSGRKMRTSTPQIELNASFSGSLNLSSLFKSPAGNETESIALLQSSGDNLDISILQPESGSRKTRSSVNVANSGHKSSSPPARKRRSNVSIMSPLRLFMTPETSVSKEEIAALQSSSKAALELSESRRKKSTVSVSDAALRTSFQKSRSTYSPKNENGRLSISISSSPLGLAPSESAASTNHSAISALSPPHTRQKASTSSTEYPVSPLSALSQASQVQSTSPLKSNSRPSSAAVTSSNSRRASGNRTPPTIVIVAPTPEGSSSSRPSTPPNATPPQVVFLSSKKSSVRKELQSSPPTPSRVFRRNPSRSAKKQTSGKAVRQRINSIRSPNRSSVVKKLKLDPEKPDKKKMAVLKICHMRKSPISKGASSIISGLENVRRSLDYGTGAKSLAETPTLNNSLPNVKFGGYRKIQDGQDGAQEETPEPMIIRPEQASPKYELLNALYLSKTGSLSVQKPSRRLRSNLQNLLKTSSTPPLPTSPKKLQFKTPLVEFEGASSHEPNSRLTPLKSIVATSSSASPTDAMNRMYTSSPAVSYTDSSGRKKTFRISPSSPSKGGSIKELIPEDELPLPESDAVASTSESTSRKRKLPVRKQDDEPKSSKRTKGVTFTPDGQPADSPPTATRQTRSAKKVAMGSPKKKTAAEKQLVETPSSTNQVGKVVRAGRPTRQKPAERESPADRKSPKRSLSGQSAAPNSPEPKTRKGRAKRQVDTKKGASKSPSPRKLRGGRAAAISKSPSSKSSPKAKEATPATKTPKRGRPPKINAPSLEVATSSKKARRVKTQAPASPSVASPKRTRRGVLTKPKASPKEKKTASKNSRRKRETPSPKHEGRSKKGASKTAAKKMSTSPGTSKSVASKKTSPSPKIVLKKKKSPSPGTSKSVASKKKSPSPKVVLKKKSPSPGTSKSAASKKPSPSPKIVLKKATPAKRTKAGVSASPKKTRRNNSKAEKPKSSPKRKAANPKEKSPSPKKLRRGAKKETLAKPLKKSPAKKSGGSKPVKATASKTSKRSPKELRIGKLVKTVRSKK